MRSEIEIRVTIMIMGVISILVLSGTVMNTLASGTAVNANVKVKSAMYLGKLTKFTSLNADNTMWNNTRFGTPCFTSGSKNGQVLLSSNSPMLISESVCPTWLPEK
jgi:hypothetical protein